MPAAVAAATRQIHHVQTTFKERWVLDPALGPTKRREQVLSRSGMQTIVRGDKVWEVQPDGSFLVDEDTANYMTNMPNWYDGPTPFAPDEALPTAEDLAQPRVMRVE